MMSTVYSRELLVIILLADYYDMIAETKMVLVLYI